VKDGTPFSARRQAGITQIGGSLSSVNGGKAWSGITLETLGASHQNSAPNWNCKQQGIYHFLLAASQVQPA
jgi:hypothetical protein